MRPVSRLYIFLQRILSDLKKEDVFLSSCGSSLNGIISRPECDTNRAALLLHPHPLYGGDKSNSVVIELERIFLELGYVTLRFDFRGVLGSYAGVQGAVDDAMEAIDYLDHSGLSIIGLAGYSFGGSVALRLASNKWLSFVVALSASMNFFLEGGLNISILSEIKCPALLFHGLSDMMVPYSDMKRFSDMLLRVKAVALENEDHFYYRSIPVVKKEIWSFIDGLSSGNDLKGILK
jgi:alpha/beta superfamily hydrolase